MNRYQVAHFAGTARLVAAVLCAIVGMRFAGSSVLHAGQEEASALGMPSATASAAPPPGPRAVPLPGEFTDSSPAGRASGPAEKEPPVRVTISVTAGPARSPVYINGNLEGNSPFLGDISCRPGEPIRVEVVPVDAPLIQIERACRAGNLLITNEP
jgi:hypothetical protein